MQIKSTMRYHSHSLGYLGQKEKGVGEDVEKQEPSCAVGGNIKRCGSSGKYGGGSSKKINTELPSDPENPLLGI